MKNSLLLFSVLILSLAAIVIAQTTPITTFTPRQIESYEEADDVNAITDSIESNTAKLYTSNPMDSCPNFVGFAKSPAGFCVFNGDAAYSGNDVQIKFRGWFSTGSTYLRLGSTEALSDPVSQKIQVIVSGAAAQGNKFDLFAQVKCVDEEQMSWRHLGQCTPSAPPGFSTCSKRLGLDCQYQWKVGKIVVAHADSNQPRDASIILIKSVKAIREYACTDNDGQNIGNKGTVTLTSPSGQTTAYVDSCASTTKVSEYKCTANTGNSDTIAKKNGLPCPSETTCQDGRCVPELPPASGTIKYPVSTHSENSVDNAGGSLLDSTSLRGAKILQYVDIGSNNQELPLECPVGFTKVAGGCKAPSQNRFIRGWVSLDFTANEIAFTARQIKVVTAGEIWGCTQCNLVSKVEVFTTPSLSNPVWTHKGTCSVNQGKLEVCTLNLPLGSPLVKGVLLGRKSNPGNAALDPTLVKVWISMQ